MIPPLNTPFDFRLSLGMLAVAISRVIKMKGSRRLLVLCGERLGGWKGGVAWKDLTPLL